MSHGYDPAFDDDQPFTIAAQATASDRATFIGKTYLHLFGAIIAFIVLEMILLNLPGVDGIVRGMMSSPWNLLFVFLGFMVVSTVAEKWAHSATSLSTQYMGLGLYILAEAILFVPLLWVANTFYPETIIPTAGVLTFFIFAGLTGVVFITRHNFSYLSSALGIGSMAVFGLIIVSFFIGFNLGTIISVAVIVLMCGYILYYTSAIMNDFNTNQHVAASLALFACVATLFWYVLRLLMIFASDD